MTLLLSWLKTANIWNIMKQNIKTFLHVTNRIILSFDLHICIYIYISYIHIDIFYV